LSKKLDLIA